jgi:hypothetical protein
VSLEEISPVNRFAKFVLAHSVALAMLLAPLAAAVAQDLKPVALVSIASVEENLADVAYITRIAGQEDVGKTAMLFGNALTAGIDKSRPIGMYVVPQAGGFQTVAFIPVSNLKLLLEVHKEQVGEPEDVGGNVLKIGTDRDAYVKEVGGWAFVAESKEHLSNLPQDPAALLGDLPKTYNVAGRILIQNIPEELRRLAVDEMKLGMERFFEAQPQQPGLDREQTEQIAKAYIDQIEKFMQEADEITLGLGVDATGKRTFFDIAIAAREGTDLARQMALQNGTRSQFGGFLLPEASVTLNIASVLAESDKAQVQEVMKAAREQAGKQIDDDPNLPPEKREAAKKVLGQLLDVMEKTLAGGKIDGGAALVLMPKSISLVAGGYVADGAAMEKAIKDLVELGKNEPNFPEVKFNVSQHAGVQLHTLEHAIPESEAEARELLGEKLQVVIGTGKNSFYVSLGKDCESLLKKVIDKNAADAGKELPPSQLNVSLLPILKFYASVDDNPIVAGLVSTLEQEGNDKLIVVSSAGPKSVKTRIEVQEGLVRVIGDAVKAYSDQINQLQQ